MTMYISQLAKDKKVQRKELEGWKMALSNFGREWGDSGKKAAIEVGESINGAIQEMKK